MPAVHEADDHDNAGGFVYQVEERESRASERDPVGLATTSALAGMRMAGEQVTCSCELCWQLAWTLTAQFPVSLFLFDRLRDRPNELDREVRPWP